MWCSGSPKLGKKLLNKKEASFYFEINEDFNLNLKLDSEMLDENLRDRVWERLDSTKWPSMVNGHPRQYKQSTYVLYECDFGFLENLNNMPQVARNLNDTIEIAIQALA